MVDLEIGNIAGELRSPGSTGTPQGSVISPFLFNLVMIGLADQLTKLPNIRHSVYADDIIWTTIGSNAEIEETLQTAVYTVENHLE